MESPVVVRLVERQASDSRPDSLVVLSLPPSSAHVDILLRSRPSIWKKTGDYDFSKCDQQELKDVATLYDVIAAKLRIAFPTPAVCKELVAAISRLPDDPAAVTSDELIPMLKQYLRATKVMRGVGIPVAICALAVLKERRYAPMDEKNASGLQKLDVVTKEEAHQLTGSSIDSFVKIYATKVLPHWFAKIRKRAPEQADSYWGLAR